MIGLNEATRFALDHGYNLTGPLRHDQVTALANQWFPTLRFHERERFHPIAPALMLTAPVDGLAALPEPARDRWRLTRDTPTGERRFDPPLVIDGSGVVLAAGPDPVGGLVAAAFTDDGGSDPTVQSPLSADSVYTHGASLDAAIQFFGASDALSGLPEPSPADPRRPRHAITVVSELRVLIDVLKHELELDEPDSPRDALWGRFAVETMFFRPKVPDMILSRAAMRQILRALVASEAIADPVERQNAFLAALAAIPPNWSLDQTAWNAVTGYAFLEYTLVYAMNDFGSYDTFGNDHEGDIEGFCLVFERGKLADFAAGGGVADCIPHTIITSVHEELNDADNLLRLSELPANVAADLQAWVAPGSHATYLSRGPHDVVDLEDILTDYPGEVPPWVLVLLGLTGTLDLALAALLIFAIVEHFSDIEDQTSDNGISVPAGPTDDSAPPPTDPTIFTKTIDVIPLGDMTVPGENLYNGDRPRLAIRAFPGKWGGNDGLVDHSSPWENKTARFFRDFVARGDIKAPVFT